MEPQHTNPKQDCAHFKGVVPLKNGHFGAQIYADRRRIWLGTFKSEAWAATAYDSAAINLRLPHRNFPSAATALLEPHFQSHFSTDQVMEMIKNGSYRSKFESYLRSQRGEIKLSSRIHFSCTLLFHKELTPSDVGKLNRLVVPKRYAVKYFGDANSELEFNDREMSVWKFRYCYWKSSQSYVLTRGWQRFVKEKKLMANDTVSFYAYDNPHLSERRFLIDYQSQSQLTRGFKLFGVKIDPCI